MSIKYKYTSLLIINKILLKKNINKNEKKMIKIPMTKNGLENLKKKLLNLKNIDRKKIIKEIEKAREYGDLKENAEYHAAKEQQYIIEMKISELENKLSNAQVIEINKIENDGKIIFGSTVCLINIENNDVQKYKIVGEDESNIKENKISINSPMARALIGKKKLDIVEINVPKGIIKFKINEVLYK